MDITKRLGTIDISKEFTHDFDLMKLVFSEFIPLSIYCEFPYTKLSYTGYSVWFTPVKEGGKIHKYEVEIRCNKDLIDLGVPEKSIVFHPLSEEGERLTISIGDGKTPSIEFVLDRNNDKRNRS